MIAKELAKLTDLDEWSGTLDSVPLGQIETYMNLIKKVTLLHVSDFQRRVVKKLAEFPYALLVLVWKPGDEPCQKRQSLCKRILETPEQFLHLTALKIKKLFQGVLQECALTGLLCMSLWCIIRIVACAWRGDTQAIEGINSMITATCRRCPNISMPLLDARIGNRRYMEMGGRQNVHANRKWSQPLAGARVRSCVRARACARAHPVACKRQG